MVAAVLVTDRLTELQNFFLSYNSLQLMPRLTIPQYSFFCIQCVGSWVNNPYPINVENMVSS